MHLRWLALSIVVATTACGGSDASPAAPGGGSSGGISLGQSKGTISATVDGAAWSGTVSSAAVTGLSFGVAGENTAGLIVSFGAPTRVGTTTVGLGSITNGGVQQSGKGWHATLAEGSGTVTVTTFSSTGASGTFSFTMVPLPTTGASGNRVVTNGSFNVTF